MDRSAKSDTWTVSSAVLLFKVPLINDQRFEDDRELAEHKRDSIWCCDIEMERNRRAALRLDLSTRINRGFSD